MSPSAPGLPWAPCLCSQVALGKVKETLSLWPSDGGAMSCLSQQLSSGVHAEQAPLPLPSAPISPLLSHFTLLANGTPQWAVGSSHDAAVKAV